MISHAVFAGDPDIISDFVLSPNTAIVGANYFTYTRLQSLFEADPPEAFTVSKVMKVEFPVLDGQSVSYAVLQFPSGAVNPPHTHPRGAEVLFLVKGSLQVGFVDTANKLYTQTLQPGDMFVFPTGLIHYQICGHNPAIVISAFRSANAGTVSIPATVFATGIDENILSKSFKTDIPTIEMLKFNIGKSLK
ncbi:putative germin-like protein 9-2 [Dioscorea cayenensis subsp. rotundata]|uniref:Germin-like protein n=1 Tax=Dioscorea cayennensis subsp. rotundata TaxID=55577 RepID=A0AB40B4B7_DIOCR|nr:putative germin-like protein 9-2 [Dioscorea cayenensis subsp. rotundata]